LGSFRLTTSSLGTRTRLTAYFESSRPAEVPLNSLVLVDHLFTLAQQVLLPHLSAMGQRIFSAESWQDKDRMGRVSHHHQSSRLSSTKCHNRPQDFNKVHLRPRHPSNPDILSRR
jgi:hypothetical protein